jgi:hypothetical protein
MIKRWLAVTLAALALTGALAACGDSGSGSGSGGTTSSSSKPGY